MSVKVRGSVILNPAQIYLGTFPFGLKHHELANVNRFRHPRLNSNYVDPSDGVTEYDQPTTENSDPLLSEVSDQGQRKVTRK